MITFVGEPEAVLEGAFRLAAKAVELIDMSAHHGAHPRIGAVDVVPFVPVSGVTMEECADLARRVAFHRAVRARHARAHLARLRRVQVPLPR